MSSSSSLVDIDPDPVPVVAETSVAREARRIRVLHATGLHPVHLRQPSGALAAEGDRRRTGFKFEQPPSDIATETAERGRGATIINTYTYTHTESRILVRQ